MVRSNYPFDRSQYPITQHNIGIYSVLFMSLLVNYRCASQDISPCNPLITEILCDGFLFRQRPAGSRSIKTIRAITIFQYCMVTVHISLSFYQNFMAFAVRDDASVEFNELGAATYTLAQLAIEWTNVGFSFLDAILFSVTTSASSARVQIQFSYGVYGFFGISGSMLSFCQ